MRDRRGFTLLELLLASALMAVLMIGVLVVLTSVMKPVPGGARGLDAPHPASAVGEAWVALVRDDLAQARRVTAGDSDLVIISYGGLDPSTGERTHRPVRVHYLLERVGDRVCLLRDARALDDDVDGPADRELVGVGVTRFELIAPEPIETATAEHDRAGRRTIGEVADAADEAGDESPERLRDGVWRLRLWTRDSDEPAIDRAMILSRGLSS